MVFTEIILISILIHIPSVKFAYKNSNLLSKYFFIVSPFCSIKFRHYLYHNYPGSYARTEAEVSNTFLAFYVPAMEN
ncbi:hypothetical protein DSUL_160008 [Desulfovibrionales bacterium]